MQTTQFLARRRALTPSVRSLTTAANAGPIHVTSYSSSSSSVIPLSNIEAQWEKLSAEEQTSVHAQLEELQKKDWRKLSIDEKKAGASPVFCPSFSVSALTAGVPPPF
jgi:cytochrome c oxidase subunit 4